MGMTYTANSGQVRVNGVNGVRCGWRRCWICDARGMIKQSEKIQVGWL